MGADIRRGGARRRLTASPIDNRRTQSQLRSPHAPAGVLQVEPDDRLGSRNLHIAADRTQARPRRSRVWCSDGGASSSLERCPCSGIAPVAAWRLAERDPLCLRWWCGANVLSDAAPRSGAPIDLPLRRWIRAACVPSSAEACVEYFDLLEHALADLHLSDEEAEELRGLQDRVGLRASQVRSMHSAYFESLCRAALADGVITDRERSVLRSVAASLGIPEQQIPETSRTVIPGPRSLPSGTRICFTGAAVGADGGPILREWLEGVAASRWLQPVAAVTKKGCDLLVVADLATQSSKARKAREYAIPVIDVSEYLRLLEADPGAL